jgi:hypothetical protein
MIEPGKDDGIDNKREQERETPRIDQFQIIFSTKIGRDSSRSPGKSKIKDMYNS